LIFWKDLTRKLVDIETQLSLLVVRHGFGVVFVLGIESTYVRYERLLLARHRRRFRRRRPLFLRLIGSGIHLKQSTNESTIQIRVQELGQLLCDRKTEKVWRENWPFFKLKTQNFDQNLKSLTKNWPFNETFDEKERKFEQILTKNQNLNIKLTFFWNYWPKKIKMLTKNWTS